MIECHEMDGDGNIREVAMEELRKRAQHKWFTWIAEVGRIVGWSVDEVADHVNDPNWFGCFDDGMTPKEAVREARSKGVV